MASATAAMADLGLLGPRRCQPLRAVTIWHAPLFLATLDLMSPLPPLRSLSIASPINLNHQLTLSQRMPATPLHGPSPFVYVLIQRPIPPPTPVNP
jgi:hypothetical protein